MPPKAAEDSGLGAYIDSKSRWMSHPTEIVHACVRATIECTIECCKKCCFTCQEEKPLFIRWFRVCLLTETEEGRCKSTKLQSFVNQTFIFPPFFSIVICVEKVEIITNDGQVLVVREGEEKGLISLSLLMYIHRAFSKDMTKQQILYFKNAKSGRFR